ncbi:MAG: thermonuclease family protein [Erythrobacter sp.]
MRRWRLRDWWLLWRVPILALIVMAAWWFGFRPIAQEQGWVTVDHDFAVCIGRGERQPGCVVDGDTVVIGFGSEQRRIRLTGFDAPELDGACQTERDLAIAARARLHQWLAEGSFEWNGAEDPPRDRYGRELRRARRVDPDGSRENLAESMVASGLAAASGWGAEPRDWCEG